MNIDSIIFFLRERERERECLSVNHVLFSRNSENRQVIDTALMIDCLYVKFYANKAYILI